jgi:hypothetical protein
MTLGVMLSSKDETTRRNAVSILKRCQKLYGAIMVNMNDPKNWNYVCDNDDCTHQGTLWTMKEVAEKGTPVCNLCGADMVYIGE